MIFHEYYTAEVDMLFNSISFLLFFPIVFLVYGVIPRKARKYWLLITSYYFYMHWNIKYGLLLAFSTLITYVGAIFISKGRKQITKKIILGFSTGVNLLALIFFKYADFIIININRLDRSLGGGILY